MVDRIFLWYYYVMNFNGLNILYYDSKEITLDNIIWGLLELGANVERSKLKVTLNLPVEEEIEYIKEEVIKYNCVITQNFSVNVAIACFDRCVPYISWIYDSPQVSLYTDHSKYPTNFIFAFDKKQVARLKECGIDNVFHMPLAANMAFSSRIDIKKAEKVKYSTDISFIGQLYRHDYLEDFFSKEPKDILESLSEIVNSKACDWGKGKTIYNSIPSDLADKIYINKGDFDYYKLIEKRFIKETLFIGPMVANKEREVILSLASENFKMTLYTTENDKEYAKQLSDKLRVFGRVKGEEPYKIYASSKLNLNLTLRTIETAVPQRIFDIMSMAGAVISNYQEEAEELFVPDKEILLFDSKEEFLEKADFYLKNYSLLKKIGEAGYRKVREKYNYVSEINSMFDTVINVIG